MRDSARIDVVLERLRAFWKANADWPLGQIVFNACDAVAPGVDVFFPEDDEFLRGLDHLMQS